MKIPQHYNHREVCSRLCESLRYFNKGREEGRQVFFHSPNSDDLLSLSQRLSEINYPIMIAVEGRDSDFHEQYSDALWKDTEYFIMILDNALDTDTTAILSVQSACEEVATEIQSYLIRKAKACEPPLAGLDYEKSLTIRSIGAVGESLFGVVLKYNVWEQVDTCRREEMWND